LAARGGSGCRAQGAESSARGERAPPKTGAGSEVGFAGEDRRGVVAPHNETRGAGHKGGGGERRGTEGRGTGLIIQERKTGEQGSGGAGSGWGWRRAWVRGGALPARGYAQDQGRSAPNVG
jgi:hypothetical protein